MKAHLTLQMLRQIDFSKVYPFHMLDGRVVQTRRSPIPRGPHIIDHTVRDASGSETVPESQEDVLLMEESIHYYLTADKLKRFNMPTYVMNPIAARENFNNLIFRGSEGNLEPGSFSGRQIGEETYVDKWQMEAPGFQLRMITLDGNVVLLMRLLGSPFDRRVHKREDFRFTDEEALWAEEFVIQTLKGFARQGYTQVTQP